ncbi:adenylate/guanylate cyclase domain-containing protein [Granulosicoccus sp. 3-233]|uniref:adenylate/guanylate cyclase domain-containing protein n=1 Tax=Granulosicoccus sp. 3-233 TaxID=3417969 RepID=UPI003D350A7B
MVENGPQVSVAWDSSTTIEWLLKKGRLLGSIDKLTHQLGHQLLAAGAPLWRFRVSMRTLHPLVAASTCIWERDEKFIPPVETGHGVELRSEYIGSPFEAIARSRSSFRRRLEGPLSEAEHTVLHEIKARGGTDYFGLPLEFTEGAMAIMACSTDRPGGFSDTDLLQMEKIAAVLAPIAEVFSEKKVSCAVANAYLGRRTGQRVLSGQITRGNIEKINAAIMISDVRDWTGINIRLPGDEALALVNRYFEILADAVEHNGGELLKFIGDSILAIFPLEGDSCQAADVCEKALLAAQQAVRVARHSEPALGLDFGIGIHFGEVYYGNIGSSTRIDFTVMGQAVNTTARMESLCRKINQPILLSEDFASQLKQATVQVAEEMVKGYAEPFRILTTVQEQP